MVTGMLVFCCFIDMPSIVRENYPHVMEDEIVPIVTAIVESGQKYDISPVLLFSVLHVESKMGKYTQSETQDYGPMQINEFWFPVLKITEKDVSGFKNALNYGSEILATKRNEIGRQGCWWSVYNSRTPRYRRKYEYAVREFMSDTLGLPFHCNKALDDWQSGMLAMKKSKWSSWPRFEGILLSRK